MDKVSVFESSDFGELRIIVDPKGDVWFVASDVAKSLGYINAKDAVKRHVDDDDSMLLQVSDNQWGVKRSILKTRYIDSIRIINESGLYSLILSSKLESAKRFKKWVTSEVLPSIRKTGEYKTSSGGKGILVPDFSNPADAARAWADQYEAAQKAIAEKSQAEAEKQQALKTIEEHKPDVEFAESFRKVDHNNMWLIRDIAKKLEQNGVIIAEKNLRSFLEEAKFMFRNGLGKWELYSNVVVKGYGVYRSYFIDKYSGDRINQQTIYMTGSGYEVTLNGIKGKLNAQTVMINDKFCQLEMREMQNTIAQLREEKAALTASALSQQQTQNIVGQLRPTAVPAYPSCSPYQAYTWGQVFGGGCCNNGCGCNNGCCNNNAAV